MTYRAAIVGLGRQAEQHHIPGLLGCESADLVAICDVDPGRVAVYEERLSVPGYCDVSDLLAEQRLDFVIASTPHDAYPAVIEAAAKRGTHVLKEKPFARNLSEARRFHALAKQAGITLMTACSRRFNPLYQAFPGLLSHLGRIYFVEGRYTLGIRNPGAGWRGERVRAGGGCIIDMGYHMVDLVIWYFGQPHQVAAHYSAAADPTVVYDSEDTAVITFNYESGLYGTLTISRSYPPKTERFTALGSGGSITIDRSLLSVYDATGSLLETRSLACSEQYVAATQIEYFCRMLSGKVVPVGLPVDHLAHLEFIDACFLSHELGQFVELGRTRENPWAA